LALSTGWKKISPFTLIGVFVVLVLLNFETLYNLPPKFLKAVFQSLVKPLTILFIKSLNFGVVPGDWKLANVSPIYNRPRCQTRSNAFDMSQKINLTSLPISKFFIMTS
jgi:hypothetical protein